ncbi:hypothetical protein [Lacipirellula parvula]|uniref:Uncharacterized protein n=1 Tax=Lacipirellula parvula TaxID=2650471 RepID=A0A5K7XD71_9BACT|nr:hypothetical protein [Lacipirellula parvula]BBO34734.1 hypothetical protein PLANPX_4346 [Lacipirellula parvula]
MSGRFLYFVGGDQRPVDFEKLAKWQLSFAIETSIENRPVSTGPSGGAGNVFMEDAPGVDAGYYPDDQTWSKMPAVEGRPELWIGYWNDRKPTPQTLKRAKLLRGPVLTLADGNEWQVPIVRRYDGAAQQWQCELPAYLAFDGTGKVGPGRPLAKYAHLWDATATIAELQFAKDAGDEAREPTQDELLAAVSALMGANYRVSLPELIALEALEETHLALIVMVAVRYESLVNWLTTVQKKSSDLPTLSGATSSDGEAA